jgi:hypothetical protein
MTEIDVLHAYRETVEFILVARPRRILVFGGTDSSKSTYYRFLVRELVCAGHLLALVVDLEHLPEGFEETGLFLLQASQKQGVVSVPST